MISTSELKNEAPRAKARGFPERNTERPTSIRSLKAAVLWPRMYKVAALPEAPGVYIFKDAQGRIIYVGKAKSLKKRVQSYSSRLLSAKTQALVSNIADIEYRLCQNESAALLLEAGLVHKYQPKFNISLRDSKSFPYVKITPEDFPAICITRKVEKDRALYLGPYTSAKLLRQVLKIIRRNFPYRSCRELPREPCLYYRMGLSPGPCIGKINKTAYAKNIENIRLILAGKTDDLIRILSREMKLKSQGHRFEEAAKIRDQINALSIFRQNVSGAQESDELADLKKLLHLTKLPERIEAFDISDISGAQACGSMVSFYKGRPDKNNYRRFRIRTVRGIDDYKMMSEVVHRRYKRVIEEKIPIPDLILIDGGKSHLLVAKETVEKLGLSVPMASIAKEQENIYVPGRKYPLRLSADTPALNLIRRIRDEAHRFALKYHRLLRRKKTLGK